MNHSITHLVKQKLVVDYLKPYLTIPSNRITKKKIETLGLDNTGLLASAFEFYLVLDRIKNKQASDPDIILNEISDRILGIVSSSNKLLKNYSDRTQVWYDNNLKSDFYFYIEGVKFPLERLLNIAFTDNELFEHDCYQGVDTYRFIYHVAFPFKYKVCLTQ